MSHLGQDLLREIYPSVCALEFVFDVFRDLEVLLEVREAELVARFKLTEILRVLLYGIVRQVDEFVAELVEVVLLGARAQVALLIEVAAEEAVYACKHPEDTNVKLSPVDQERPLDVLLDDDGVLSVVVLVHRL